MIEVLFIFITKMLVPISISGLIIFIICILNKLSCDYFVKSKVLTTVKAVEQTLGQEDSYLKLEAVKDLILSEMEIDEEELTIIIEATVFDLKH